MPIVKLNPPLAPLAKATTLVAFNDIPRVMASVLDGLLALVRQQHDAGTLCPLVVEGGLPPEEAAATGVFKGSPEGKYSK